jgi:hypothetical protein
MARARCCAVPGLVSKEEEAYIQIPEGQRAYQGGKRSERFGYQYKIQRYNSRDQRYRDERTFRAVLKCFRRKLTPDPPG